MFSDMSDDEAACVALGLAMISKKKLKKKKKRKWMKEWLKKRHEFSHENLLNELRESEPNDFRNFLRLDGPTYDALLKLVTPRIEKQNTKMRDAIPASQRLSITLRYLATGNTFEDLKFTSAISAQAIGKIVIETCEAIIDSLKDLIKVPENEEEWNEVADGFKEQWNFPHCLGAVDGKHVAIKKPPHSGSLYYNYKKFFSIVLMAVVNSNYEFIMVDAGINGRVSDGGVLSHTKFGKALSEKTLKIPEPDILLNSEKKLPFVFVGDDAFALTENMMKPYSQTGLTVERRIFNYRLSRARRIVENVFGILVSRFGVLQRTIALCPEKAQIIVLTCCYLHNYLRRNQPKNYITRGSVDFEDIEFSEVVEGSWRSSTNVTPLGACYSRNSTSGAKNVRDAYCNYFSNEGQVPWQHKFL